MNPQGWVVGRNAPFLLSFPRTFDRITHRYAAFPRRDAKVVEIIFPIVKCNLWVVTTLRIKEVAWARTKDLTGISIRPEQVFRCPSHNETGFPCVKVFTGPARGEHVVGVPHLDDRGIPKIESFSRKAAVPQRVSKLGLQRIIGRHLSIHLLAPIVQKFYKVSRFLRLL